MNLVHELSCDYLSDYISFNVQLVAVSNRKQIVSEKKIGEIENET